MPVVRIRNSQPLYFVLKFILRHRRVDWVKIGRHDRNLVRSIIILWLYWSTRWALLEHTSINYDTIITIIEQTYNSLQNVFFWNKKLRLISILKQDVGTFVVPQPDPELKPSANPCMRSLLQFFTQIIPQSAKSKILFEILKHYHIY